MLVDKGFTPKYLTEMDPQDMADYVATLQHIALLPESERRELFRR